MCRQEIDGYSCQDYLHQYNKEAAMPGSPRKKIAVDREVRSKLVDWCYSIVDFCHFNRETVSMAISYLDRFLLCELGLVTLTEPAIYQLAAMTALYTAIKIHEPEAMDPELISNLSHGAYTIEQVEQMESCILQAIDWRVNTPTALAFVRLFLSLVPNKVMDKATKAATYDLTINQTEYAVKDYKFVTVKASTVGFVSLMNALESLCVDSKTYDYVAQLLSKVINVDPESRHILEMQHYLYPKTIEHSCFEDSPAYLDKNESKSSKASTQHDPNFGSSSPCSAFESFSSIP